MSLEPDTIKQVIKLQRSELTEYYIYKNLAKRQKDEAIKKILITISNDELKHSHFFKKITKKEVKPKYFKIWFFKLINMIFGVTFSAKLLEKGEESAQDVYGKLNDTIEGIQAIINDEEKHEQELINTIDEERLKYVGSIVLGLNDALVELTGALAGLTFALADAKVVALAGLITGIAAAFSMASSEYLSTKQDESHSEALKSAIYTGVAYLIAVMLLVLPYLIGIEVHLALAFTITIVVIIIFIFNYYISVAKDLNFKKRFLEMVGISLGVAFISFLISIVVKAFLGV